MPRKLLIREWEQPGVGYAVITGVFMGIGFLLPGLWFLGIFGMALCIRLAICPLSRRQALRSGGIAWFIKYLAALVWYASVYPIEWIAALTPVVQLVAIGMYWITSALWLAVGGVAFVYVSRRLATATVVPRFLWFVLVPCIWVGSELVGAWFFSCMTAGPGSFFQTYFSFGMMGYLFAETQLGIALSGVGGVYGLSLAMVALALGLLAVSNSSYPLRIRVAGAVVTLLLICSGGFILSKEVRTQGITVVGVDTNFSDESITTALGLANRTELLTTAINAAVAVHPNFILLPEESRLMSTVYAGLSPETALSRFLFTHGNTTSTLIDSGRIETADGRTYLRATILDGLHKTTYQFDKQYLVPQGEYVPTLYASVLRLIGLGALVDRVEKDSSYRPGPLAQATTANTPLYIPGILFCFESVRPTGARALAEGHPVPFIVHPLSHSWFHTPLILWHQLDVMLVVQARWSGVLIVSAGNLVAGKLYAPNGTVSSGAVIQSGDGWLLRQFTF